MSNTLANEFAEILRRALRGEVTIYLHPEERKTWDEREFHGGNTMFTIDGWKAVFFNDCDVLDYTDLIVSPDGRQLNYDEISEIDMGPIELLSEAERQRLRDLLKRADWKHS